MEGRRFAKPPSAWRIWQQAGLGTLVGRERVELVVAYRAEQDGVGVERSIKCRCGQGRSTLGDGDAADQALDEGELVATELSYSAQNIGGFAG